MVKEIESTAVRLPYFFTKDFTSIAAWFAAKDRHLSSRNWTMFLSLALWRAHSYGLQPMFKVKDPNNDMWELGIHGKRLGY